MREKINTTGRKGQKGRGTKYERVVILDVVKRYLNGSSSSYQLAAELGIPARTISYWSKRYSSELSGEIIISPMTEEEQRDFEALKKQNEALRKKLEYEQMKNFALETMADLAKTELGIDIRKNSGAKQPKE